MLKTMSACERGRMEWNGIEIAEEGTRWKRKGKERKGIKIGDEYVYI